MRLEMKTHEHDILISNKCKYKTSYNLSTNEIKGIKLSKSHYGRT